MRLEYVYYAFSLWIYGSGTVTISIGWNKYTRAGMRYAALVIVLNALCLRVV